MNPFYFLRFSDTFSLSYITKAFALSYIPTIFLSLLIAVIAPVEQPDFGHIDTVSLIPALVIFAPLVETLMMWPIIFILEKIHDSYFFVVIVSAFLWAIFHSLQTPAWGLFVFWPFVIFSSTLYIGRKKHSFKALVATFSVHALHNLPTAILMVFAA